MNKNNIPPGIGFTLLLLLFSLIMNAKGIDPEMDKDIRNRVESLSISVSVKYNKRVKSKIAHLVSSNKNVSAKLLGRTTMYFPLIEGILREKGLPQDLKYLAVIESGLNPEAVSKANATGMWQFMKPTARYVGLNINRAVDERRDPIKSTYAAIDYMTMLHKQFGDWTLALAAYNCGPGNVRKAIRRSGGIKDYWAIQHHLPKETQNYIPKLIAMNYMMNYYYVHDILPEEVDQKYTFTASVKVFDKTNLKDIAKEYDLDFSLIKRLNPSFIRNFIPQSEGKHYLTLPEAQLYDYVNKNNGHDHMFHVNLIVADQSTKMKIGPEAVEPEEIHIARVAIKAPQPLDARIETAIDIRKAARIRLVKLGRGQTILDLANEYSIPIDDLIADNNYSMSNLPKQGDLVRIVE
jgi:membrane-bound lytic murein transglycosylase D